MFGELALRDDAVAVMHQVREDAKLMARQLHGSAIARDARQPRIERYGAAADGRLELAARPPDERAEPREHLFHPEWLRHIVVRAFVDSVNRLVPASAGGEHEHGHGQPRTAPAAEHRQAVDARQSEVENHRVVPFRAREKIGALAALMRVLVVEDEASLSQQLSAALAGAGYAVDCAADDVTVTAVDIYRGYYGIDDNTPERFMRNARIAGVADRAEAKVGDARELPLETGAYDGAISLAAIDHIRRAEILKALAEAAGVLKPRGEFLLMVVNVDHWAMFASPHAIGHHPRADATRWRAMLDSAGFEIVEEGTRPAVLYFLTRKRDPSSRSSS